MELIGNRTGGEAALVRLDRSGFRLGISDSAFFGNIADPGADALVVGSPATVWNSAFVANAIVGELPLLQTGAVWADHGGREPWAAGGIQNAVFSRNRWVATPPADPELTPSAYVPSGFSTCAGVPAIPYETRPHPFADATTATPASVIRAASRCRTTTTLPSGPLRPADEARSWTGVFVVAAASPTAVMPMARPPRRCCV